MTTNQAARDYLAAAEQAERSAQAMRETGLRNRNMGAFAARITAAEDKATRYRAEAARITEEDVR